MEDTFSFLLVLFYGAFFITSLVIIIYLIIKRIKNKGKEGFEMRDN